MNSLGYLIAALLLAIYGGRLIADARAAAGTWAGLAKSAGGYLSRNNGWLKIAAAFLAGVVCCYVVSHGVSLPNIDWPNVVKPDVVPSGEFRAFIVREVGDKLTRDQETAINSTAITAYLNAKTAKVDGRPGWRRWDDDTDTSNESPAINALWQRAKATPDATPKLVVFVGDKMSVYSITNEADTLATLKKIGGA